MNERRAQPRVTLSGELRGTVKSSIDVRVLDLSEGGMRVQSTTGLAPGTDCTLTLETGGGQIRVRATVLRSRAAIADGRMSYASGLRFVDDADTGQRVRELVEAYRGDLATGSGELDVASAIARLEDAGRAAVN